MRQISSDQEHVFAHQNNLYQQHGKHLQCKNYGSFTYLCRDHNKLNTIGVHCWTGWQNCLGDKKVNLGDHHEPYNIEEGL